QVAMRGLRGKVAVDVVLHIKREKGLEVQLRPLERIDQRVDLRFHLRDAGSVVGPWQCQDFPTDREGCLRARLDFSQPGESAETEAIAVHLPVARESDGF